MTVNLIITSNSLVVYFLSCSRKNYLRFNLHGKPIKEINQNGQNYANENGDCVSTVIYALSDVKSRYTIPLIALTQLSINAKETEKLRDFENYLEVKTFSEILELLNASELIISKVTLKINEWSRVGQVGTVTEWSSKIV